MKTLRFMIGLILIASTLSKAETHYVNSQQTFDQAHDQAVADDSIVWRSGTFSDIYMNITNDRLFVTAEILGKTIFSGASRVNITGDHITLQGFQFLEGNIGTNDVINIRGSNLEITQINIRAYTSYKYLRVREESQYVHITYCNFENRLNLDDQNILSILVDDTNPGYHKIQYCSFKNFDGTGNDLGIEPIRIGLSTQADRISRTLVEYCYFTQCNGDGELISSKASQNVYRFNTFENNQKAELVLRHGSEAIVYGNFFLNGKGGVRVREGQDHYIYNNYFFELDDRAIYLQNEDSDPLDNIHIAFNTIVDCSEIILGGDGEDKPTHVTLANNIFTDPDDSLFEEPTGTETWVGNMAFGNLGMALPASGVTVIDPQLVENSEGFFGLSATSPAIDAAQSGYALLPQFDGIDNIDSDMVFDMMGQGRPTSISEKDLGSNEYPHSILIQPLATEENTGPSYETSTTSGVDQTRTLVVDDLIQIDPNPVRNEMNITIDTKHGVDILIDIFDVSGRRIDSLFTKTAPTGKTTLTQNIEDWPAGAYFVRAMGQNQKGNLKVMQTLKLLKAEH